VTRRLGGVDGALHVEDVGKFQRLARLGSHGGPQGVFDGGEAALDRDGQIARQEEAEREGMFT
jgi:hypothetical protein